MAKKILVVKIGTSTLLGKNEQPSGMFNKLAGDLTSLRTTYNIALVSSGAIGFGARVLRQKVRPAELDKLQALSCIGQPKLMAHWQRAFKEVIVGQALATSHELDDKSEEKKLVKATHALWNYDSIPIFNENDALADEQIKVGDNDTLAAHIAVKLKAASLIFLSDIDGVYENFKGNDQILLREVSLDNAKSHIHLQSSAHGTGGLATKSTAAEIAGKAGISTYLANAHEPNVIRRSLKGEIGTRFVVE